LYIVKKLKEKIEGNEPVKVGILRSFNIGKPNILSLVKV